MGVSSSGALGFFGFLGVPFAFSDNSSAQAAVSVPSVTRTQRKLFAPCSVAAATARIVRHAANRDRRIHRPPLRSSHHTKNIGRYAVEQQYTRRNDLDIHVRYDLRGLIDCALLTDRHSCPLKSNSRLRSSKAALEK